MAHRLALIGIVLAFVSGCSRGSDRATAASPTAPSATAASRGGSTPMGVGGVSGPMDALFPSRGDSFEFRRQLETKYQTGLNRAASTTFVDREGEVVWVQEYMRYRVNGCDQSGAIQRVFAQIDGNAPGAICAENPGGQVLFPPRNEALDFRRQLETKYQQMSRGVSQSFVDAEGGVIWTQEYIRYRTNACDHATAVQKVFAQIDGSGIAGTCYVPLEPCAYRLTPSFRDVGAAASTNTLELFAVPGGCAWTATSNASWLTLSSTASGSLPGLFNYAVATNPGAARAGEIKFEWQGGSAIHRVNQVGTAFGLSVQLFDPARSVNAAATCQIRSSGAANTCNLVATATLPSAIATYAWTATYVYGTTTRTVTQTSASNTLAITDQCGLTGSSAEGVSTDLNVSLTVTDTVGNTHTLANGQGLFRMAFYTCGA